MTLPTSAEACCYTTLGNEKFKFSANMEENANKMHLCTDFNSSACVTVYAKCIYVLIGYMKY